jgi:putative MATE family efflux protein
MRKNLSRINLTEGTIWKQLVLFALPLLGSSFIQQLYNTVDLWYAGNMLDKNATASVGASSMIITCITGFFTGISVGISVIVSHAVGSSDKKKVDMAIHTAIGLSISGGLILSVIGILSSEKFLHLMNTPEQIFESSLLYIKIYMLSMVPIVTYNMSSGIIRALGNSSVPLIIQLTGGIVNIIMDFISIRIWNMRVEGIAWATMFSQGIAAIMSIIYLMKFSEEYKLKWRNVHIYKNILSEVCRIGIPAGLQSLIITLSNVFIQYKINGFDVDAISAFSIYFKVELIIYLPIVAFGQAMMTFAGQNTGAKKFERIEKGIRVCIITGCIYATVSAVLLIIFGKYAFGLFNEDNNVISCGIRIIKITFPFYWIYVILEVIADTIRGTGKSFSPMIIIMLNICVLRTLILAVITHFSETIEAVASVYPVSWFTASLCFIIYWKKHK